jgi:hypothetical protein
VKINSDVQVIIMTHDRKKEEFRFDKCIVQTFFKLYCILIDCKGICHLFHASFSENCRIFMFSFFFSTHGTQYPIAIYHQFMQQIFSYVQEAYFSYSSVTTFCFLSSDVLQLSFSRRHISVHGRL